jgi:hypothetical protein
VIRRRTAPSHSSRVCARLYVRLTGAWVVMSRNGLSPCAVTLSLGVLLASSQPNVVFGSILNGLMARIVL